jgi:hypothetical protein
MRKPGGDDTAGPNFSDGREYQPNTPRMMAPTNANATYAVTTLNLLTVMGRSLFTSLPASNANVYQAVPGGKSKTRCPCIAESADHVVKNS